MTAVQPLDGIVTALQNSLVLHWSQAEMYAAQSAHFAAWGYQTLAETWAAYAAEEREHIRMISSRLETFDEQPEIEHDATVWPRHDFVGILDTNYFADTDALNTERAGYSQSLAVGDPLSANLFAILAKGSEESMAGINAIRSTIEQIGLDNYLALQVAE